jgi:hypothetical protein
MSKEKKKTMKTPDFVSAMQDIVWYDGHQDWLADLRDDLRRHPDGENYMCPFGSEIWHSEPHVIWMLLVGMFGNWGTSIRSGWIDDKEGCIAFIDRLLDEGVKDERV